jgi:DNA-binding NtrC family response regulator
LRSRRYRIRVLEGPDVGRQLDIGDGTVLVGSHRNAELQLGDKNISRFHLELQPSAIGLRLIDLDSTNGTFVDDVRLGSVVVTGDVTVRLGSATVLGITSIDVAVDVDVSADDRFGAALGASQAMRALFGLLDRVAATEATVLLQGEPGSGKDLLAEAIHGRSRRHAGPFVVADCATLPPDLAGGELFGHAGLIRRADGGTLVLDELEALPLEAQSQLLRVLEKREVRAIGEVTSTKVDLRVIATTRHNLSDAVRTGTFRDDLYYRVAVVRAAVPPLRRRTEDIPLLTRHFLRELQCADVGIPSDLLALMMTYHWPGNVRELRSVVERAISLEGALPLVPAGDDVGASTGSPENAAASAHEAMLALPFKEAKAQLIEGFEREYLQHLMNKHAGNLTRAAAEADVDRNYVRRLLQKYGIGGK